MKSQINMPKMARITKEQHAASDLLDFMHFHEVSFLMIKNNELCENINKIIEAQEGMANVRTLNSEEGLIKILTNNFFLEDVEAILEKLKKHSIEIEILEKREWQGVL